MLHLPEPRGVNDIQRFVSTFSWYRRFVPNFAELARPLTDLLKKGRRFEWTDAQRRVYNELKKMMSSAPCLAVADDRRPFFLYTNTSGYALGAVLCQEVDTVQRPLEYASRLLSPAERNYSTVERETLALVWVLERFRGYLECSHVQLMTDHQPLRWLMLQKSPHG